jgi:6-phosphogluconolactonase
MPRKIEVLPDLAALVQRSLELTLAHMHNAIQARGLCTIALSGGSTPKPLYEAIAAQALPWEKIHVFWGDERYVPADSPESNQRMARQAWLDTVEIPAENIHPMPTDAADPADAACQYEAHLKEFFQLKSGEFPALDVNLLGMGDDGHTASLFPHTAALQVCDRIITVGNKDGQPRITFTIPTINQAHCTMFLVSGANKQAALAQVFAPVADDYTYPARFVQPQGELWWLLDRSAGENLQLPNE